MDRLQALQLFVRIAETNSFSQTAKEAVLSQATVSKRISELEIHLQTKLFARTTRRLNLTEAGKLFHTQAKAILEQYDFAIGEVKSHKLRPSGTLRLSSPIFFGRRYITPLLASFNERYPDIVIDHFLSDSVTDLVHEGIDISIRMGTMRDSTHLARKLTSFQTVTVASKDFLKKWSIPTHPHDLEKLPCLIYTGIANPQRWEYVDKRGNALAVNVKGPYKANVVQAVLEAGLAGMGVLRGSSAAFADELQAGRLVRLLRAYEGQKFAVNAVTPSSAFVPNKSRLLIDHLESGFKANPLLF